MNSLKYGIIGKNWGYTIFKILRSMNKNCIFLNIKSPKKYKSQSEYKNICSKIIKDTSKNVDIVWIAVPSNEKFYLVNECIKNDLNIILEKPWLYSLVKSKKIIKLQETKKLQIGVHYEYLYLKKLISLRKKNFFNKKEICFNGIFNVNSKKHPEISPLYELGSHLMSIKLLYFNKTRIKKFECSYNKSVLREVKLINDKKERLSVNFTNNKELIIQKYIDDYEKKLLNKEKYNINLKFACNVYKNIKYLIKKEK